MKNLLIVLSIACSLQALAQNPQLLENTWYLQNVIIDNQDNFPPVNNEVEVVEARFYALNNGDSANAITSFVCNSIYGLLIYDSSNSVFDITYLEQTFGSCNLQVNTDFEILYFDFYYDWLGNPFEYSITTDTNGDKALVVTHANGDQTIYGDQLLGIPNRSTQEIGLFPNPVTAILHLHAKLEMSINKAAIYDVGGKLVLTSIGSNDIPIQNLKAGVYFIKIEDKWGNLQIERFVKK